MVIIQLTTVHVPCTQDQLLHLLGMTTIVSQGLMKLLITPLFISTTPCGMERVVVMVATAVHNLECPGSVVGNHRSEGGHRSENSC